MHSAPDNSHLMRENFFSWPSLAALSVLVIYLASLPPKWATLHISGLLLVLVLFLARRDTWRAPAMRTYMIITCSWLVPVIIASTWQNLIGLETATHWGSLLKLILRMLAIGMGIILLLQRGWLTLRTVTIATLGVLVINAATGYAEIIPLKNHALGVWRSFRMEGLAGNPNPFGTFMALATIVSAGLLRSRPRNLLLWMVLLISVIAIWGSGSRGAVLAATLGLLALYPPRSRMTFIALVITIGILATVFVLTGMQFIASHNSDLLRIDIAGYAIEKIMESPFHGWGLNSFADLPGRTGVSAPHNMILDLAVTSGVVAVLGWLWSTGRLALALAFSHNSNCRIMFALLTTAIVSGTLEYSILNSTHFQGIWMLITALACWSLETANGSHDGHRHAPGSTPSDPRPD